MSPKKRSPNNLTSTQLGLLSAAAQREDGAIELAPNLKGGAADKVVSKLLRDGLIEEIPARGALPIWRRDEEKEAVPLRITTRGLAAIGIDEHRALLEAEANSGTGRSTDPACNKPARNSHHKKIERRHLHSFSRHPADVGSILKRKRAGKVPCRPFHLVRSSDAKPAPEPLRPPMLLELNAGRGDDHGVVNGAGRRKLDKHARSSCVQQARWRESNEGRRRPGLGDAGAGDCCTRGGRRSDKLCVFRELVELQKFKLGHNGGVTHNSSGNCRPITAEYERASWIDR